MGKPGRIPLDFERRAARAYSYSTRHDKEIPKLRNRIDELERDLQVLADYVRNLAASIGPTRRENAP
jgi:hypothetical protein